MADSDKTGNGPLGVVSPEYTLTKESIAKNAMIEDLGIVRSDGLPLQGIVPLSKAERFEPGSHVSVRPGPGNFTHINPGAHAAWITRIHDHADEEAEQLDQMWNGNLHRENRASSAPQGSQHVSRGDASNGLQVVQSHYGRFASHTSSDGNQAKLVGITHPQFNQNHYAGFVPPTFLPLKPHQLAFEKMPGMTLPLLAKKAGRVPAAEVERRLRGKLDQSVDLEWVTSDVPSSSQLVPHPSEGSSLPRDSKGAETVLSGQDIKGKKRTRNARQVPRSRGPGSSFNPNYLASPEEFLNYQKENSNTIGSINNAAALAGTLVESSTTALGIKVQEKLAMRATLPEIFQTLAEAKIRVSVKKFSRPDFEVLGPGEVVVITFEENGKIQAELIVWLGNSALVKQRIFKQFAYRHEACTIAFDSKAPAGEVLRYSLKFEIRLFAEKLAKAVELAKSQVTVQDGESLRAEPQTNATDLHDMVVTPTPTPCLISFDPEEAISQDTVSENLQDLKGLSVYNELAVSNPCVGPSKGHAAALGEVVHATGADVEMEPASGLATPVKTVGGIGFGKAIHATSTDIDAVFGLVGKSDRSVGNMSDDVRAIENTGSTGFPVLLGLFEETSNHHAAVDIDNERVDNVAEVHLTSEPTILVDYALAVSEHMESEATGLIHGLVPETDFSTAKTDDHVDIGLSNMTQDSPYKSQQTHAPTDSGMTVTPSGNPPRGMNGLADSRWASATVTSDDTPTTGLGASRWNLSADPAKKSSFAAQTSKLTSSGAIRTGDRMDAGLATGKGEGGVGKAKSGISAAVIQGEGNADEQQLVERSPRADRTNVDGSPPTTSSRATQTSFPGLSSVPAVLIFGGRRYSRMLLVDGISDSQLTNEVKETNDVKE
ncbi:MAG: hypothetical protein M1818_008342 [Claussenomyces sp. TS43310]|nr:MAG: hypothetical protein M1818_008342 [Claussenomyces sp. TS43310]